MSEQSESPDPRAVAESHPVVLFDGVCNLCNGYVQFLIRRDSDHELRFASLQSAAGQELLDAFELPTEGFDSIVLVEDGDYYRKSEAVLRIARHLDSPYPLASALRVVPRVIRDAVYDIVAQHRYRVFGKREECMVPTPEIRAQFLE